MTQKDSSALRDDLAEERTRLAQERTFLAYIRTALGFLAVGVGVMQFFGNIVVQLAGWLFIFAGIGLFLFGLMRFKMSTSRGMRR
jgi:inner membrane protein YidH